MSTKMGRRVFNYAYDVKMFQPQPGRVAVFRHLSRLGEPSLFNNHSAIVKVKLIPKLRAECFFRADKGRRKPDVLQTDPLPWRERSNLERHRVV